MILIENEIFHIRTKNTSYVIGVKNGKYLENLYYGAKIRSSNRYEALREKYGTGYGNAVMTPEDEKLTLENLCLEYSSAGIGDYRHSPIEVVMPDGSYSTRFEYTGYKVYDDIFSESDDTKMPYARGKEQVEESEQMIQTLEVILKDTFYPVTVKLIYTVFSEYDVITRRTVVVNECEEAIQLQKVMSMQLDLPEVNYQLETFDGLWTRERHRKVKKLVSGLYVNDSVTGASSNRHNPFIMLSKENCTEQNGDCIGINLIYSGNHYEAVEVSEYEKVRVMTGLNAHRFQWTLNQNETFYTPEAVITYSRAGYEQLSENLHQFAVEHIMPRQWAKKERPILLNNWEATYFDFNKSKLLKLAKDAKQLGVELFVLDDGWFGNRNDDKTSLGDWTVNEKKLGGSLASLSEDIHKLGLQFGLWVEPEMISEQSELFKEHPEYAIRVPNRTPYLGRNQLVLDLTKQEVVEYVVEAITKVLGSADINYVKWDMNRPISDAYSSELGQRQGEFYHRYMLGLYEAMDRITNAFPDILFESCSAGGNRFDLGMLYYMPQTWTSDDTDANERITIQEGTSYGYPLASMGAHVSAIPNHQTLRSINLETRFEVACFGLLGYELDVTKLNNTEKKIIKKQIEFYKEYRRLFQFGKFSRMRMHNGNVVWQVVSEDQSEAMVLCYQQLRKPNCSSEILRITGLDEDALYTITARKQAISIKQFGSLVNQVSPVAITEGGVLQTVIDKVYTLESEEETYEEYGDLLANAGIKLKQQFVGTGYDESIRVMSDFSSRLYIVKKQ